MRMRYRPEVDGLRAIAVAAVIIFHSGCIPLTGGFLGVDIFFVISGYLITKIICNEMQNNSFSFPHFYKRRVLRILPALFLVCICCIPFAFMLMLPNERLGFAKGLISVTLFASNIFFWRQSGYFDEDAALKPLLHTWSLGVEEQFYILFPLFLFLAYRFIRSRIPALVVILTVGSLGLAEWMSRIEPDANFYLLPFRAWEFGAGAILALGSQTWEGARTWWAQTASAIGLVSILYALAAFDETTPFPSLWGLIPVLGTMLVIAYARHDTVAGRVLAWSPVVALGLISYSAYLWHQPVFVFYRMWSLDEIGVPSALALVVLILLLAYLSWRFVEKPFQFGKVGRNRIFVASLPATALAMLAAESSSPRPASIIRSGSLSPMSADG